MAAKYASFVFDDVPQAVLGCYANAFQAFYEMTGLAESGSSATDPSIASKPKRAELLTVSGDSEALTHAASQLDDGHLRDWPQVAQFGYSCRISKEVCTLRF